MLLANVKTISADLSSPSINFTLLIEIFGEFSLKYIQTQQIFAIYIRKLAIRKSVEIVEFFSSLTKNLLHFLHFLLFLVNNVNGLGKSPLKK